MPVSKNLIEEGIENKLISDIKKLKNIVIKLRQKQDVGADVVQIVVSTLATADFTLAAGVSATIQNTATPVDEFLSVWNLLRTLEANDTGSSPLKHWPEEADASAHNLGSVIRFEGGKDLTNSDDGTGKRVAFFVVENNDNHTLDFTYSSKWYGNKQTVTAA